jgi:hypothetical protein
MEPILYCACYDHLCSNNPTNCVLSPQCVASPRGAVSAQDVVFLQGVVFPHDLLRGIVLCGLVRRLQGLYFRSLNLRL